VCNGCRVAALWYLLYTQQRYNNGRMDASQRRLPDFVRAAVEQRVGTANIEFALASDLSPEGRFGESWLVLANETLLTLRVDYTPVETSTSARLPWLRKNNSQNGASPANGIPYLNSSTPCVSIQLVVPLTDIAQVRTTQLVGASALEAVLHDGRVLELIRYSSALAHLFGHARLRLEAKLRTQAAGMRKVRAPHPRRQHLVPRVPLPKAGVAAPDGAGAPLLEVYGALHRFGDIECRRGADPTVPDQDSH